MATTHAQPRPGATTTAAVPRPASWPIAAGAAALAVLAATATAFELLAPALGLATTVLALLVALAERGLCGAAARGLAIPAALGAVWIVLCFLPFEALLFPGAPLHEPIVIRGGETPGPTPIPAAGRRAVDLLLEAELPPNPSGGPAIPVSYTLTIEDAVRAPVVLSGRFEDNLRTRRLGRRGTATTIQAHHAERRLVPNGARGDLALASVTLEPAAGAVLKVTALPHHLPPTPVLAVLAAAFLAAAVAVDARIVPASEGTLTFATGGALGTALALWTSNVVHPTVSSLIGAIVFGGPIGLGVGALLWAVARRALVHAGR